MKREYIQLVRMIFQFNSLLFAFGFFTLVFVLAIIFLIKLAGIYSATFYIPEIDLKPLPLLGLTIIKFYFFWSIFSLASQFTKSVNNSLEPNNFNVECLRQVRKLLVAVFFLSAVIYLLELPQLLGPFDSFLRLGPTEKGLSEYTIWQSILFYFVKIFSFELSGIVSLILGLLTFMFEGFVNRNQSLQNELEEVI